MHGAHVFVASYNLVNIMKAACHSSNNNQEAQQRSRILSNFVSRNELAPTVCQIALELDINARDATLSTLLHLAARNVALETAQYLLDYGAKGNMFDEDGNSPFSDAVWADEPSLAKLLIDRDEAYERCRPAENRITSLH